MKETQRAKGRQQNHHTSQSLNRRDVGKRPMNGGGSMKKGRAMGFATQNSVHLEVNIDIADEL